ncbi:MAG: FxLYD domain-containing protein [Bacteroidota bacterium]
MKSTKLFFYLILSISLFSSVACQEKPMENDEEEGVQLSIDETYDSVQKGVRLIMSYDDTSSSFVGTVENVTNETIKSVRVEVHLSNGVELGPTTKTDIAAGEKQDVQLSTEGESFTWWSAHAESGEDEHGTNHEGEVEHKINKESEGEHNSEHESGEREHKSEHEGSEHK